MAETDEALSRARGLISAGRFDEAVALLESWLEDNPEDADDWAALGAAYFESEDYEASTSAARRVVDLQPESARAWCNYGTVLRKLGRAGSAHQAQQRALALDPEYQRATAEMGKLEQTPEAESNDVPGNRPRGRVGNTEQMPTWKRIALIGCSIVWAPVGLVWGLMYLFTGETPDRKRMGKWAVAISLLMIVLLVAASARAPESPVADQVAVGLEETAPSEPPIDDQGVADLQSEVSPDNAAPSPEVTPDSQPDPEAAERERVRTARAWSRRGKTLANEGRYTEALECFENAKALGLHSAETWIAHCEERLAIESGALVETGPQRAHIYADLVRAEDRAEMAAYERYPDDITRAGNYEDQLAAEYKAEVRRKHGITKREQMEIIQEGTSGRYPMPDPPQKLLRQQERAIRSSVGD